MVEEKSWYLSKTIWGSLISVAAALGGALGIAVDAGTQQALTDAALQIVGAVGALAAIYGRLKATHVII